MSRKKTTTVAVSASESESSLWLAMLQSSLREGVLIVFIVIAVFLLLAFATFHASDPGWTSTGSGQQVANLTGRVGAWFANVFLFVLGYAAYLIPILLVYGAALACFKRTVLSRWVILFKTIGFFLVLIAVSILLQLSMPTTHAHLPLSSGGIIGQTLDHSLEKVFNVTGTLLILLVAFLIGLILFAGVSWFKFFEIVGRSTAWVAVKSFWLSVKALFAIKTNIQQRRADKAGLAEQEESSVENGSSREPVAGRRGKEPAVIKPFRKAQLAEAEESEPVKPKKPLAAVKSLAKEDIVIAEKAKRIAITSYGKNSATKGLPELDLLDLPEHTEGEGYSKDDLKSMSLNVETCLGHFGIEVKVVAIQPGPVITRFELSLAAGVKVSKISSLAKDIARSLSVQSVRIVEVIAGKSVIGLEVPNEDRETVYLREVLESAAYQDAKSPLSLTLGKDIGGHPVVVDLAKMPHVLVAGTTGAGKSVSVNAMILSMILKATPDEVRFIMIDPKMLELSIYEGIPHLLAPVITDMKEAANGLRWCVAEMDRRYRLMASLGVRNLQGYNAKVKEAIDKKQPLIDPIIKPAPGEPPIYLEQLPSIVVIIDEFADMMIIVGKKVEELITRIAQKARAAGIHLLLATQRPSVDVITGVIKANIPTRVAFQVSSRIDSRTILDQQGAEQLLGQGDMLYLAPGTGLPVRVHGAFVSDSEVHRVVQDWKTRGEPHYIETILEERNDDGSVATDDVSAEDQDELYDQAVALVVEAQRPSISYVQRRLKIGFNRAARLLDAMEHAGVISPMDQNGNREMLVSN